MKLTIKKVYTVNGKDFTDANEARKAMAANELVAILGKELVAKLTKENRLADLAKACNIVRTKKAVGKKKVEATVATPVAQ